MVAIHCPIQAALKQFKDMIREREIEDARGCAERNGTCPSAVSCYPYICKHRNVASRDAFSLGDKK